MESTKTVEERLTALEEQVQRLSMRESANYDMIINQFVRDVQNATRDTDAKKQVFRNFKNGVKHSELQEAAQPLHQMLCDYGDPHTTVIIEQGFVRVVQDELGAPLQVPN